MLETLSWVIIVLILSAILGLGGILFAKEKKTRKTLGWIGAIGFVLALLPVAFGVSYGGWENQSPFVAGTGPGPSTEGTAGTEGIVTQELPSGFCPGVEDTTVTFSGYDVFTSAVSGGNHRYRINGAPALTVADAGTFTASPGDKLSILFGNASTTGEFSVVSEVTVPCAGTKTFSAPMVDNGTITTTFRNTVGDRITATGVNQTIGANDLQTVDAKLTTTSESAFPHGIVIVLDYNKTALDDVKLQRDGVNFETSIVPNTYSALWGVNGATKAYIIPDNFKGGVDLLFKVVLDSGAMNPTVTNTANVTLAYFPRNYYINDDLSGAYSGPSHIDEDSVLTRPQASSGQLYYD